MFDNTLLLLFKYEFILVGEGVEGYHIPGIPDLHNWVPKPRINILKALLLLQHTLEVII